MSKYAPALLAATVLFCSSYAQAAVFQLDFTATGSWDGLNGPTPNDELVSGSFVFTAPTIHDTPTSIKAVSLVLDGHVYSTAEIGIVGSGDDVLFIGATVSGKNRIVPGSNDFFLYAFPGGGALAYASTKNPLRIWDTTSFTYSYTQLAAVPEVDTYAMLVAGLGLIGVLSRRRKHQA